MGPRSILPSLFTTSIYIHVFYFQLQSLLPFYFVFLSFVNSKAEGIDNPSILVGSKVTCCVCRSRSSKQPRLWTTPLFTLPPTCIPRSHTGDKPWDICQGKFATTLHLNLPLGVTNEGRELSSLLASSKFLAPLPGTPVYKIGELHTIFYICLLVLLVYRSFFAFMSFTKNTKK